MQIPHTVKIESASTLINTETHTDIHKLIKVPQKVNGLCLNGLFEAIPNSLRKYKHVEQIGLLIKPSFLKF